ncbi:MAG: chain-length determining protein [Muribaculaceae bacterium]|nr:chain-length determining protein [Muribaculaceae bacterium]
MDDKTKDNSIKQAQPEDTSVKDNTEATSSSSEEKEIDLLELAYKLWDNRKLLLIWCMWGVLAGLIIAFSIPREYTTSVKLAPEVKANRAGLSGGLGALASMAGINASGNTSSDAVYPQLYPDIMGSVPFVESLLDVKVKDKENQPYTVREYLLEKTHGPWWSIIMGVPGKVIGFIKGTPAEETMTDSLSDGKKLIRLSVEEDALVNALRNRVTASVDQKTSVITINAQMQDPVVSAILADTVVSRLREYVTEYRTDKARQDLNYAVKLNDEAQQEYYKAQQRLADYIDRNQNLATQSARITRERLENESSLAFNLYNETSLQVQNAKSKVQETTPVYTIITPATVPLKPTSPRKGLIIGGCAFLAVVICAAWILFGTPLVKEYKLKVVEMKKDKNSETPSDEKVS